ncbi:MAG: hypothetical protein PHE24_06510 [Patescibacteria group bacterium]|nr:hypothetical protein [Patescibacteria group bacterium]
MERKMSVSEYEKTMREPSYHRCKAYGCGQISSAYDWAREILGQDLITPEEIAGVTHCGFVYSKEQLAGFANHFWRNRDEDIFIENGEYAVSTWRADDFMVIAGPPRPMSLVEIIDTYPSFFRERDRYHHKEESVENFSQEKVEAEWLVISKQPRVFAVNNTWEKQCESLCIAVTFERVPNIAELAWTFCSYKAVRGSLLAKVSPTLVDDNIRIRSSSFFPGGDRAVFCYDCQELHLFDTYDNRKFAITEISDNCIKRNGIMVARIMSL